MVDGLADERRGAARFADVEREFRGTIEGEAQHGVLTEYSGPAHSGFEDVPCLRDGARPGEISPQLCARERGVEGVADLIEEGDSSSVVVDCIFELTACPFDDSESVTAVGDEVRVVELGAEGEELLRVRGRRVEIAEAALGEQG